MTDHSQSTVQNSTEAKVAAPETKFCKFCASVIAKDAVLCTACGRQVEELKGSTQQAPIVINNTNSNVNTNTLNAQMMKKEKNKWVALALCFFIGILGGHKFYEGKVGMGILYLFTAGLMGIGVVVDFIVLLFKPNPYYI